MANSIASRVIRTAAITSIAGGCCAFATYQAENESRIRLDAYEKSLAISSDPTDLEGRTGRLDSHTPQYLVPVRASGMISTMDEFLGPADALKTSQQIEARLEQDGTYTIPELHVPSNSSEWHRFDIHFPAPIGAIINGSLDLTKPSSEIGVFDWLHIYRVRANVIGLAMGLHQRQTVSIKFKMVVFREASHDLIPASVSGQ